MTIATITGQIIQSLSGDGLKEVSRNNIPSGMYFATITKSDGTSVTQKLIFQ